MTSSAIDVDLLMELVRKYKVELMANPNDRRQHWVAIAADYNKVKGTSLNYQSLSKKLANIKQRDRQKILAEKRKTQVMSSMDNDESGESSSKLVKTEDHILGLGFEAGRVEDDDEEDIIDEAEDRDATESTFVVEMEDLEKQSQDLKPSGAESNVKPFKVIRVVQEKGSLPSARLVAAEGLDIDPMSEEAEACTRQGYENLLRDLLICLAKKHRIEELCGSPQVKHDIWRQLTNEYLQLTGGLVNVSQRDVMRKWANMKFTLKNKGSPHPLLRADKLDINKVAQKLKLCQRFVIGDEAMKPTETTKRLEAIKEKVKAKTLVEQAEREERPPIKLLERQILVETLRYEQERLQSLLDNSKLEQQRLSKDVDLVDVELEKARYELELTRRSRQM